MSIQPPLPKAEAKVIIRNAANGLWSTWRDLIEMDPVVLPTDSDGLADVFDATTCAISDAILDLDELDTELMLVWSDGGKPVKGLCPMCDDLFVISDGWVVTVEIRGGIAIAAVGCGCADLDG